MKKYFILFIAIFLFSSNADAMEYELLFHAYHYDVERGHQSTEFNDNVYGVGIIQGHYGVGYYINSYKKHTLYAVRIFPQTKHFGFEVGAATGYEDLYGLSVQPLVVGYYQVGRFKIRVIPGPITAFGFSVRIGQ